MLRHALDHHHVGQRADRSGARPTSFATDHQALSGVLIDQVQYPRCATILRSGAHEVVAPHMVPALRPEPNARSIVEPQPPPWLLLLRNFQPFATPDALDSILANMPVRPLQQSRDASVTAPPVLAGQFNNCLCESILVFNRQFRRCPSVQFDKNRVKSLSLPLTKTVITLTCRYSIAIVNSSLEVPR